jgi:hypothetical protein
VDARQRLAEELLQEAVYRSRARQAAGASLQQGPAGCGLGDHAAVELELSPRGRELLDALWPEGEARPDAERLRAEISEWVERQDRLDRKRNHFLRDFRQRHGADRRGYAPEVERDFEAGLARVNAEVEAGRSEAARRLVDGD